MSTMHEQETTVTKVRADDHVYVFSNDPKHVRRLRSEDRAVEIEGGEDWGRFKVAAADFDPLTGFRRRVSLTEEQREAIRTRLARTRAGSSSSTPARGDSEAGAP